MSEPGPAQLSVTEAMADMSQTSRSTAVARFLIVNADDFGRSEAVNQGVAEGFRRGIVTSASLVAAGPAFESAVRIAADLPGLGVGIHLIANEYTPILPPAQIPRLVNSEGRFYSRPHQFARMAWDPRLRRDLLLEWDAQISKILRTGIKLTHIDGHGHCHAHPAAAGVVLELAGRYGIEHVRLPAEPILWKPGRTPLASFRGKSSAQPCDLGAAHGLEWKAMLSRFVLWVFARRPHERRCGAAGSDVSAAWVSQN